MTLFNYWTDEGAALLGLWLHFQTECSTQYPWQHELYWWFSCNLLSNLIGVQVSWPLLAPRLQYPWVPEELVMSLHNPTFWGTALPHLSWSSPFPTQRTNLFSQNLLWISPKWTLPTNSTNQVVRHIFLWMLLSMAPPTDRSSGQDASSHRPILGQCWLKHVFFPWCMHTPPLTSPSVLACVHL